MTPTELSEIMARDAKPSDRQFRIQGARAILDVLFTEHEMTDELGRPIEHRIGQYGALVRFWAARETSGPDITADVVVKGGRRFRTVADISFRQTTKDDTGEIVSAEEFVRRAWPDESVDPKARLLKACRESA